MNEMMKRQLEHRTIREFQEKKVPKDVLDELLKVANSTATSTGMQSYSIIRVKNPQKKKAIAEVCGQDYVERTPELWIFIADAYRNAQIAREQGKKFDSERDMDRFFQGFTDAVLAAQNVTVAIESMDMGAVYFGSILNDTGRMIEILELPELTFPVLGIGFGYPNQEPQKKPRMPMEFKVFEDSYKTFDNYLVELEEYDEVMQTYYDLREANRRVDSFTKQVVTRLENPMEKRAKLLQVVKKQGFDLGVSE